MHPVHEVALRAVDLNLLVALDALLHTHSVTGAAEQLGRTQSAMSHALSRLRMLFGDPLLVRVGRGMVPTPRAESIRPALRAILVDVERVLLTPTAFDATSSTRVFRMACPDLFEALVLPAILTRLAQEAPSVEVVAMPVRGTPAFAQLLSGELDVVVLPVPEGHASPAPTDMRATTVLRDTLVAYMRADHPALEHGALSLDAYCSTPHLMVTQVGRGPGPVDDALAEVGRSRTVSARIRSFLTAPHVLAETDLILTGPASLAALVPPAITSLPTPIQLPGHRLDLVWHPRQHADPGHVWFRELVQASMSTRS